MASKQDLSLILLAVTAVAGSALLLIFTGRWGIGISPDSVTYISAARNLLAGKGLTALSKSGELVALTHYPPLYSTMLAALGLLGIDPLIGARWLGALFFGANIMLTGFIVRRHTRCIYFTLFSAFVMLTSNTMIIAHSLAMSEPLFLFFGIFGVYLLAEYFDNNKRLFMIASAVSISLAFLSRYPGVVFAAVLPAAILLLSKEDARRKVTDFIYFALIASLPMMLWLIRNILSAGTSTNRDFSIHLITIGHIKRAAMTFSTWLLPGMAPSFEGFLLVMSALGILFLGIILVGKKRERNVESRRAIAKLPALIAIFIPVYMLFLLVSVSFFDVLTPLNFRIMSPVYILGLILALCFTNDLLGSRDGAQILKRTLIIIGIVFAALNLWRGSGGYSHVMNDGIGLSGRFWVQSEIVGEIKKLPQNTKVYTNAPELVYFFTSIDAAFIPSKGEGGQNADYDSELGAMGKILMGDNAALVYINGLSWRWFLPTDKELMERLPLTAVAATPEGTIYRIVSR